MSSTTFVDLFSRADFGRQSAMRSPLASLLARNYGFVLTVFSVCLVLACVPWVEQTLVVTVILLGTVGYLLLWPRIADLVQGRLSPDRLQLCHAVILLTGITLFAAWISVTGHYQGPLLWLLSLPPLLIVSLYSPRQRWYAGAVLTVASVAAGFTARSLAESGQPQIAVLAGGAAQMFAVLLASGTVHYLARVNAVDQWGDSLRSRVIQDLLQRLLTESDAASLWWAIRDACVAATGAARGELYLYDPERRRLTRVEPQDGIVDAPRLGSELVVRPNGRLRTVAARVVRDGPQPPERLASGATEFAVPIHAYPGETKWTGSILGVIALQVADAYDELPWPIPELARLASKIPWIGPRLEQAAANKLDVTKYFLEELLRQIWPVCTYASLRFPKLRQIAQENDTPGPRLERVLELVLQTVCHKFGFEFATISLLNDDGTWIRTLGTKTIVDDVDPAAWKTLARHSVDGTDIQAEVLRTGRMEVISGADPRLDAAIFQAHNHAALTRVFLRLGASDVPGLTGAVGTLEAGFRTKDRPGPIPPLLLQILTRYARLDVAVAIRDALAYDREQRLANSLARLHALQKITPETTFVEPADVRLQQFVSIAAEVLGSELVVLYVAEDPSPLDLLTLRFKPPIWHHVRRICKKASGGTVRLNTPDSLGGILRVVAQSEAPYYQADALGDTLLTGPNGGGFTVVGIHGISSFAGVPLRVGGLLLGVLCLNYNTPQEFGYHDRRLVELVASHALDLLAGALVVRDEERRHFQAGLHNAVKTQVSALLRRSEEARDALYVSPSEAAASLHQVRRIAVEILSNCDLLTSDLQPGRTAEQKLFNTIEAELLRIVGPREFGAPGSRVTLHCRGLDDQFPRLPFRTLSNVQGTLREAVWNALKHSEAAHIAVRVVCGSKVLRLTVDDDGRGFNPNKEFGVGHRGLGDMCESATTMGAKLEFLPKRGSGTRIRLTIPLAETGLSHARQLEAAHA